MGIRQWKTPECDPARIERLVVETGQPELVCRILAARGVVEKAEADRFLAAGQLDDPWLLAGMEAAVQRIRAAMEDGERICVYGDYDCDGITSTALLTSYFQAVGADVIYYVPHREKEGYGLNNAAIDMLQGQQVDLIVTVDNGISSHEEIDHAASLGIDVVVTDHHTPRETLPAAVAVVNPHRADCPSRFKELAGVGVAFKLICALEGADDGGAELLEYYSDIVSVGTIADVVSLTGENRTIVQHGLSRLPETQNAGLAALIAICGLQGKSLTSEAVAFGIIPRINASGRIGLADDVIELLLTDDPGYAAEIAEQVNEQNVTRKKIEDGILREIEGMLAAKPELLKERVLIVAGRDWHHGVVGIVSAKLVERYGKPCIVFSLDGEEARGSGRSIKGFSLIGAITACSARLLRFGGHTLAAGLTLPAKELDAFIREFQDYARANYPIMPLPELAADCALGPGELTVENIACLDCLEPFGAGNEAPLFYLPGLRIEGVYPTGDRKHIRIRLSGEGASFYAIYFGVSDEVFPCKPGDPVEVMARINLQEYNGKTQLSVKIADLRPSGVPQEEMLQGIERYACYQREEEQPAEVIDEILPAREDLGLVYKYIRKVEHYPYGAEGLYFQLMHTGINFCRFLVALDVLEEMGFVRREGKNGATAISIIPGAPKADLGNSGILHRLAGKRTAGSEPAVSQ